VAGGARQPGDDADAVAVCTPNSATIPAAPKEPEIAVNGSDQLKILVANQPGSAVDHSLSSATNAMSARAKSPPPRERSELAAER
jgi:hypothetical protein